LNILITGDSHLAALDRALKGDDSLCQGHNIRVIPLGNSEASHNPYFQESKNGIDITLDRFQNFITELPPLDGQDKPDTIAVSFLFHTVRFLRHKTLWKSFSPASLGPKSGLHCLSLAALKRMVLNQQQYNLELVNKLQKYVPNVIALEGPRLFAHHPMFKENEQDILMEIDHQYRNIMRKALSEANVTVIGCPEETYDSKTGLMKTSFRPGRSEDYHHGSTEFGAMVLQDLIAASA